MAQQAGGIFVFEADNADFKNRKRAARACASCQKRKKRCSHTFSGPPDQQAEKESAEKVLPQLAHKEPLKFVGDLNPESVLKTLTTGEKDSPRYSQIGVWVEQSRLEREEFRRQTESAARNGTPNVGIATDSDDVAKKKQTAVQRYSKIERGRRTLTGHQKNYLQAVGALRVLPKATQDALITTYVACIDSLLPIIDCKRLLQEYEMGVASVFLVQAICLVACKTPEAVPFLRLYEDGPLMDAIPFARSLHTGLDAAMKADLEADRFTKVQIMTLMSLHNDGPGGIEEGSLHLVMAIHDAQTTGLHIRTPGRTPNDQAAMLWWTLWTLDKFNACLGGRPLMIADRDIDIGRPEPEPTTRGQTMAVWLALGDLLDQVIEFYRPITDPHSAGWENEFPSFQQTVAHCDLNLLQPSHRSLLELCYNIIGILACRAGGPTSKSYNRRIACASRIQQLTIKGNEALLPPLPLVPYGISLSLTVAYRGLRDSQSDPEQVTADLAARCNILESLSKTWWTADAMAKLGRKALRSIQQPIAPQTTQAPVKDTAGLAAIGDAIEAEVAVCKYGPFDNMRKSDPQSLKNKIGLGVLTGGKEGAHPAAGAVGTRSESFTSKDSKDNGLQLLSDAAARHGSNTPQDNTTTNHTDNNMINQHASKRQRFDMIPPTPPGQNATPFFAASHDSPAILSPGAATLSATGPATPFSTTNPGNANSSQPMADANGTFSINPAIDPFCATFTGAEEFQYGFNDLDNLFEGFFDLSMPTMFQDPIYEGAAYNDFSGFGGGSSGNSVDYSHGYDTAMSGMGQAQRG